MAYLPFTKSKHLLPFSAVLKEHEVSVHCLLKSAKLPLTCLDDPDTFIPAICVGSFRELAAQKTGCPDISLEATRNLEFEGMGDFGQALLRGPTLCRSLEKFRDLVATETSNVVIELRAQANGDLWFGQRILSQAGLGEWHGNLYVITWMLKIIRLAEPAWSPAEILLALKARRGGHEAIERLGSTARFQKSETGFMVPASMLALPVTKNPAHRKELDADLWSTAPRGTYAESLKQIIRSFANDHWLSIDQASEVTRTSVRTLQRRLSTEQQTYSSLVQQCRAEMAGGLLENTEAAIAEIAHQLGYGNQGNFTRAFYRWSKVSPSEFRKHRSIKD
jgi:AraC-like DNA-binding protein